MSSRNGLLCEGEHPFEVLGNDDGGVACDASPTHRVRARASWSAKRFTSRSWGLALPLESVRPKCSSKAWWR